ncbi:putative signal recognition particle SRP72 [Triangularia verruculosa]|uniref:Signal recognition particle subunit SRP72 n=1 Tax=Triangularia verruculosa TaxID=2587418 RepID=A0AAN6XN31_9PEZI|nr:putative signal recognition particle SRP72 [Triangularia verruculosa]
MADSAVAALNSLLREASIDDHAEALELATAAVRSNKIQGPDLASAQHTRVVALLKLDRYDDALRVIAEGGDAVEEDCSFEKAYALYKTGHLEGAEAVLQKTGVDTGKSQRGLKHVAGQVAYRSEKFDRAAAIYRDLRDDAEDSNYGEENDLRINLTAADAQLQWQGKEWAVPEEEKQPAREDLEAFETAYNAACICISRGDYTKASVLLKRSRDLCEATEDLDEDEKKTELVPILVQQAYVFTKLGKLDEALSLQNAINLSDVSETSTKVVAQTNQLLPKATENPFIAERLARALPKITGNDRLFEFQGAALQRNRNIIDLQAQKFEGKENTASRLLSKNQVPDLSVSKVELGVVGAAAATKLADGKPSVRALLPILEKRPNDVGLLLTIIQLYIQIDTLPPAILLLEKFFTRLEEASTPEHADARFAPGLVALAVSLYRSQNRQRDVRNELAKAAAHWRNKTESSGAGASIAREAGIELLRSTHPSDLVTAGEAFEQILSAQPGDRTATAGLVASYATTDFSKVEPHLESLPPVEKLTQGVDVNSLIEAGVAMLTPPGSQQSKKRKFDEDGAAPEKEKQQPAKKPRKRKLPKNYDPTKKPDPERWLPLRDRSTYRPKGKKGKKRAQEATQGGVVKEEETLELAGGAGSVKVEKAGGGGGGANKKKKKGKK